MENYKTNRFIILLLLSIPFLGCSPKIKSKLAGENYPSIQESTDILILEKGDDIPQASIFVGNLKIGDSGFSTNCDYETVIEKAKNTARKSGANLVKLIEVKEPSMASTCYRIEAEMYRNLDTNSLDSLLAERVEKNKSRLTGDADYAMVYFYRPRNFTGSAIGYKVRFNDDTIIGRVRNGEKFEYKTQEFGRQVFWGVTETKDSVVIDIERGQEYFVRCGIKMGVAVGRPEINLVENYIGISEYDEME